MSILLSHYHTQRPHQGVGNNLLDASFRPQFVGEVRCKRQLGGIITHNYREAVQVRKTKSKERALGEYPAPDSRARSWMPALLSHASS